MDSRFPFFCCPGGGGKDRGARARVSAQVSSRHEIEIGGSCISFFFSRALHCMAWCTDGLLAAVNHRSSLTAAGPCVQFVVLVAPGTDTAMASSRTHSQRPDPTRRQEHDKLLLVLAPRDSRTRVLLCPDPLFLSRSLILVIYRISGTRSACR